MSYFNLHSCWCICCYCAHFLPWLSLQRAQHLPELPDSVLVHILGLLPAVDQAWSARRVNKATHKAFKSIVRISASSPDLPTKALKDFFDRLEAAFFSPGKGKEQRQLMAARAACGDLAGVTWLRSQGCQYDEWVCRNAAQAGHMDLLKWAMMHCYYPWDHHVHYYAAVGKQTSVLQWLRQEHPTHDGFSMIYATAVHHCRLDIMQWARELDPPCPWDSGSCSGACIAAAQHGYLGILRWLRSQGCPWGPMMCLAVSREGHLNVLQWARAQHPPCPWDPLMCAEAAEIYGRRDVLEWLQQQ